jgi:hypothetical protein
MHSRTNTITSIAPSCRSQQSNCKSGKDIVKEVEEEEEKIVLMEEDEEEEEY